MENNKYYPMNSAELLDSVFEVYKKSFGKQIGVSIIFNIILTAILYFFIFAGGLVLAVNLIGNSGSFASTSVSTIIMIVVFILLLVLIITIHSALATTGNALITKHTFLGEPCSIGEVIKASFKKLLPACLAGIANAIVMLPVFILLAFFAYLYFVMIYDLTRYNSTPGVFTVIATILIILLALVVSIFCSAISMMSVSAAIFEKKYFFAAVAKSFRLAKPDFAKILGLVTVWTLITGATSYSITSVIDLGATFAEFFVPQEAAGAIAMMAMSVSTIFSSIVSTLLAPLSGIFSTMMYINQRFKHEGLDIELNLNGVLAEKQKQAYMEHVRKMQEMHGPSGNNNYRY